MWKERSVVIAKDSALNAHNMGSGDLCAPLFWPSLLVALLGISAHMGPGNLELPIAANRAQLVTYPPTDCTYMTIDAAGLQSVTVIV